jgi:hypothetical protein
MVQIDGVRIREHLVLVATLGINSEGFKHPLGLMEGVSSRAGSHLQLPWSGAARISVPAGWERPRAINGAV